MMKTMLGGFPRAMLRRSKNARPRIRSLENISLRSMYVYSVGGGVHSGDFPLLYVGRFVHPFVFKSKNMMGEPVNDTKVLYIY